MGDDRDSGAAVLLSFLLGGISGAVLALLYAPRSGRETREFLGEKLREGAERGRELKDQAMERGRVIKEQAVGKGRALIDDATQYVERQREALEDRKDRFSAAVEAGRQAYREEKAKTKA
ncbi:MAG TPA: YtxH domain-containing protein [Vicinamibacteria bacterium]|nr:YtxH domain-containing protein [Vicinamibacteria bacterium]